jgi:hypothetical protein
MLIVKLTPQIFGCLLAIAQNECQVVSVKTANTPLFPNQRAQYLPTMTNRSGYRTTVIPSEHNTF